MANYRPDLSCQSMFIPVDFSLQVLPGTFEYALSHIVDKHLDLTPFDDWYHNDKSGAVAYPPLNIPQNNVKLPLFNEIHQISNIKRHKIKIVKNVNVFILLKENNHVTVLSRKKSIKTSYPKGSLDFEMNKSKTI